jgi:hypothetical protein
MANYVKSGPFVNGSAPGLSASLFNAIEAVFEQPSGGTETGKYWLQGGAYTTGANVSQYMQSLSRTTVPVSVSIDTADQAPTAAAATPTTDNLTANGFHILFVSTGANVASRTGGNWTLQY